MACQRQWLRLEPLLRRPRRMVAPRWETRKFRCAADGGCQMLRSASPHSDSGLETKTMRDCQEIRYPNCRYGVQKVVKKRWFRQGNFYHSFTSVNKTSSLTQSTSCMNIFTSFNRDGTTQRRQRCRLHAYAATGRASPVLPTNENSGFTFAECTACSKQRSDNGVSHNLSRLPAYSNPYGTLHGPKPTRISGGGGGGNSCSYSPSLSLYSPPAADVAAPRPPPPAPTRVCRAAPFRPPASDGET